MVDNTNSEVIEFPWVFFPSTLFSFHQVVLDMQTLEVVYEKQLYVKPDFMEGLTPYCKVLTGITEEMVEKGCKLEDAINQFNDYLKTLPTGSYQLLTDGVWDLSVQLKYHFPHQILIL